MISCRQTLKDISRNLQQVGLILYRNQGQSTLFLNLINVTLLLSLARAAFLVWLRGFRWRGHWWRGLWVCKCRGVFCL
jgi:hypothetical protein